MIDNYDEAIAFYTQKLRFEIIGDIDLGGENDGFKFAHQTQQVQIYY